MLNNSYFSS